MMLSFVLGAALQARTLFVSPTGSDSASGSQESPLGSLSKAANLAAEKGIKRIELLPGTHLAQNIEIGPAHKGLVISGAGPEKTRLAGGPTLTKWTKDSAGIWRHAWPSARQIRCLTTGGSLVSRARFPQTGRMKHESEFKVRWLSTTDGGWERKPTQVELTTLKAAPGQIPPDFKVQNAEVTVFHMWDESTVGVKSYDSASRTLSLTSELGHPGGAFEVKEYVIWNTREGLTPGTWMQDRSTGEILYRPKPGEEPDKIGEIRAGESERILHLKGADGVTIKDLSLTGTSTPLKSGGFATMNFEGALTLESSAHVTVEGVEVKGAAGWGIRSFDCNDLKILRCRTTDIGAGGMRVEGARASVQDSVIQRIGIYFSSAAGIVVIGKESSAVHNLITDTPYSGIIGGGDGQLIESNRIQRAMTVMHDGAAIYAGLNRGMIFRGNWVSDIPDSGGFGSSAYYLDEGATDCIVEDNLSEGVARPSQNHMAKNCIIRRNLFLIQGDGRLEFARCTGFKIENNIISASGSLTFRHIENQINFSSNIFQSGSGNFEQNLLRPEAYDELEQGPMKEHSGNLRGNPGINQVKPGHYRAVAGSLAAKNSFMQIDVSKAGPRMIK